MKTLITAIIFTFLLFGAQTSFPQGPPEPPGGAQGSENTEDNQTGNGAPIGGGTFFLIAMGAAYGAKKFFDSKKIVTEEMED
ncbi:MAG: hypothetical protein KJ578_02940 [Bacteroidetes bacterium]|nr:hypothetical protein [Bacteroidota bacterium]MBU1580223.1 hypothetical protein [Bacteroidota bacterium]MBU2556718.1 hypothetical protein [Bacteroidota bacterium]